MSRKNSKDEPLLDLITDGELATYSAEGYAAAIKDAYNVGLHDGKNDVYDPVITRNKPLAEDLVRAYCAGVRAGCPEQEETAA